MPVKSLHPSILNYICQTRYVVNLRIVLQDKCCHPCHEEKAPSRVKKMSKAFTRKRRVSKFMAERIYRNTGVSLLQALVNIYCIYVFLFLSMIPRGGTVLPRKFFYFPPFFLKKKTLTGKEDHSNDILTNFYCHSYTTSNQNLTTGGCTLYSLPQLTHILKHYFFMNNQLFHRENKVTFLNCFQARKPIIICKRTRRFSVKRTEGLFA